MAQCANFLAFPANFLCLSFVTIFLACLLLCILLGLVCVLDIHNEPYYCTGYRAYNYIFSEFLMAISFFVVVFFMYLVGISIGISE